MIFLNGVIMNIFSFSYLPQEAFEIRKTVFMDEQGFVDEMDDIDSKATHFLVFDGDNAIATCRIFSKDEELFLGRFAVLKEYRNKGIGRLLLSFVEETALKMGYNSIKLHSQIRARDFYQKCGFVPFGEVELEENYPHIWMMKDF